VDPETRRSGKETSASSRHVARAELVLARPAHLPLKALPVRPDDPLQALANALGDVRPGLGESVHAWLDLVPLTPARIRRHARQVERETSVAGPVAGLFGAALELFTEIIGEFLPVARHTATRPAGRMRSGGRVVNKFLTDEPVSLSRFCRGASRKFREGLGRICGA
jgi:hypothetical protein